MKLNDITAKTDAELEQLVLTTRAELAQAVMDQRTKEIKDVKQIGRIKLVLARTLTIVRQRQLAQEETKV